jgi:hypothetical protein
VRPWLRRLQGLRRLERLWRLQGLRRLERLRMGRLRWLRLGCLLLHIPRRVLRLLGGAVSDC